MADFYDISNWQEQKFIGTGGTRDKAVFQNPDDGVLYFFKTSLKKDDKDYKYEFWSEIIASEIGRRLGFNVLRYDIAYNGSKLGCISKSMTIENASLIEGYRVLTAFDSSYTYENKKGYTFQFISDALKHHKWDKAIDDIIQILVFDSLIGNSDRHQENWGFIQELRIVSVQPKRTLLKKERVDVDIQMEVRHTFSPIYDSGSCLGREIIDDKVRSYLTDDTMSASYVGNKGKSEIHWEGEKLSHWELLSNVMSEHPETVAIIMRMVQHNFKSNEIEQIVMDIDKNLPATFNEQKIPIERKKLIIKFVTLRYEKLISMIK